jgi:CheY-like chemotaxis protein
MAPVLDHEDEPAQGRLAGLRVLLVEDDAEVREVTEMVLITEGAAVIAVPTAADALAVLRGGADLDLLFSDVVLPDGFSGIELVEKAATLRPRLPALLASGYVTPAQQRHGVVLARVRLLHKPYRCADLLTAIAATLRDPARSDLDA